MNGIDRGRLTLKRDWLVEMLAMSQEAISSGTLDKVEEQGHLMRIADLKDQIAETDWMLEVAQ